MKSVGITAAVVGVASVVVLELLKKHMLKELEQLNQVHCVEMDTTWGAGWAGGVLCKTNHGT